MTNEFVYKTICNRNFLKITIKNLSTRHVKLVTDSLGPTPRWQHRQNLALHALPSWSIATACGMYHDQILILDWAVRVRVTATACHD